MELAPIVLFVYNRPDHTRMTLEALTKNEFAHESLLYIFADGPKDNSSKKNSEQIKETREIIKSKQWCKEVIIREQTVNKGLANSIIDGVTEVVNQYGSVIVLEDDLITSKYFLQFMNEGLQKYEAEERVMQVSGYTFPTGIKPEHKSYLLPFVASWGWATWERAWRHFDANAKGYEALKTNLTLAKMFDIGGVFPYTNMLITQMETTHINSWAIRWYWSVFRQKGFALFPDFSLVDNCGYGIDATHTTASNPYFNNNFNKEYFIQFFPKETASNTEYFCKVKKSIYRHNKTKANVFQNVKRKLHNQLSKIKIKFFKNSVS